MIVPIFIPGPSDRSKIDKKKSLHLSLSIAISILPLIIIFILFMFGIVAPINYVWFMFACLVWGISSSFIAKYIIKKSK